MATMKNKSVDNALKAIQQIKRKMSLGGRGGMMGGMPNMGRKTTRGGGPGTHAPVKASGKSVGKMADGRMIHLTGPKKGQMV